MSFNKDKLLATLNARHREGKFYSDIYANRDVLKALIEEVARLREIVGGTCTACKGEGWLPVDSRLPDGRQMTCPACKGTGKLKA